MKCSRNIVTSINQVVEQKTKEMKSLECEKQKLQNTMLWIMGFKEYKKIKDIARQQIETTLKDKQALILVALVAIIEAFKQDPEKQALLSNVQTMEATNHIIWSSRERRCYNLAGQIQSSLLVTG